MRARVLAAALLLAAPVCCEAIAETSALASAEADFERAQELIREMEREIRELERTGADLSVFFGIPSESEREAARDAGVRALSLAGRARDEILGAVERADREGAGDEALRDELITANAGQLPIRIARGALLVASATDDASERRAMLERAERALAEIRALSPWIDLETDTLRGIASRLRGEPIGAIKRFDDARAALAKSDASGPLTREFAPAVAFGLIRATLEGRGWSAAETAQRALTDGPPFEAPGPADPALAVVLADVRFAIQAERAEDAGGRAERARILHDAFANYTRLAETLSGGALDAPDAWRLACTQAFEATEGWMERATLPPIAKAGLAIALMNNDSTSDDGVVLAREALGSSPETDAGLADLLRWELARALARSGTGAGLAEAARLAGDIALRDPARDDALALACSAAVASLGAEPSEADRAGAIRILRAAHERGEGRDLPAWRRALGLALGESGELADLREAIGVLSAPSADGAADPLSELAASRIAGDVYANTSDSSDAEQWRTLAESAARSTAPRPRVIALQQLAKALDALGRGSGARDAASRAWSASLELGDTSLLVASAGVMLDVGGDDLDTLGRVVDALTAADEQRLVAPVLARVLSAARARVESSSATLFLADESAPLDREAALLVTIGVWAEGSGDASLRESAGQPAATALLLCGEPERALEAALELKRAFGPSPERLRLEAEARLAVRDDAGAFAVLRTLAGATEASAATDEHSWYAWARMLEILDRRNASGERTAVMVREITRLRATAGYDVCAECVERIEAIAQKLGI